MAKNAVVPGQILIRLSMLLVTGLILSLIELLDMPTGNSSYIQSLQKSGFSRYVNQPAGYTRVIPSVNWDAYVFSAPEYQCVMEGDFGLLTHAGNESEKTILWLQAGQEC